MSEPAESITDQNDATQKSDRGLLDLSVELSMRDIMAGSEFALFVLVKNPYTKPIWIRRVHVSLPSELKLSGNQRATRQEKAEAAKNREKLKKQIEEYHLDVTKLLAAIDKKVGNISTKFDQANFIHDDIQGGVFEIRADIDSLSNKVKNASIGRADIVIRNGVSVSELIVDSQSADVLVKEGAKIGRMTIGAGAELHAKTKVVELESSLPANTALQSGNTVVYTIALNVRAALLFRPSRYRLQFNVNYSFESMEIAESQEKPELFTNTLAYELPIRSSVYAVIAGSAIGGLIGGIARMLQSPQLPQFGPNLIVTLAAAVILSVMAIIFVARKSDAQSFISVEDFWGGMLVGFFVGYSGTSFFEHLTGLKLPTNAGD